MKTDETDSTWVDVTVPLHPGLTAFPGTPEVRHRRVSDVGQGDPATISALSLASHSGTHVDAALHFREDGAPVDELDLDLLNGRARVLDLPDLHRIGAAQLSRHDVGPGERMRTRNSSGPWYTRSFDPDYAHLAADGARHSRRVRVRAVGIDYLSIGGEGRDNPDTHRVLLDAGIVVLEGLDLSDTRDGVYELRCLPLRLAGGDGAPARALLRRVDR